MVSEHGVGDGIERYGHLHFYALRKLARDNMVRGLPVIEQVDQLCGDEAAPHHVPGGSEVQVAGIAGLGPWRSPISPATPGGRRHFLLLVDDKSRYMWVRLLSTKDEAPTVIKQWKACVEAETGRVLRVLRTDNGVSSHQLSLENGVQIRG
jgi:hypothetical protein